MKGLRYLTFFCLICLTVFVGLHTTGKTVIAVEDEKLEKLPIVGSYDNLKKILEDVQAVGLYGMRAAVDGGVLESAAMQKAVPAATNVAADSMGRNGDYSQTNVQVEGVDEADTVKTDGEYIYTITGTKVVITKAYPTDRMEVVSTLDYSDTMSPVEMYVDSERLVVILTQNYYYNMRETVSAEPDKGIADKRMVPPIGPFENSVKVKVYDLGDRANLKEIREIEIDGGYVSSRKIQNDLYLVNNKYIPVHILKEQKEELLTPAYRDTAEGNQLQRIGYDEICYFPGSPEPNYLIVAAIDLENGTDQKTEVKTYLGSGQSIYSSLENLFVAVPEYKYKNEQPIPQPVDTPGGAMMKSSILPMPIDENTSIYKFSLQGGSPEYIGKGSVAGRILNQFSMDEYNGYFRIATTVQKFAAAESDMTNNLFILDQGMNVSGKIENIAPGEKIYSTRFLGDRGYMVTFKTVDPLFVLDLKDPKQPKILGELKIPGYSNYLHPYDENHILGFGKEAIEVEEPHWSGQGTVKNAYYLGMKMALFDVSDVNNPIEKFKVEIGDRGTDSELFWNHKALLFSKEKNLLAFPVTVCEIDSSTINKDDYLVKKDPRLAYGLPVFQGAFVYSMSSDKGFELRGMITHQPDGKVVDLQRMNRYEYSRDITRILYIDDALYTVSNSYLKANDLQDLTAKGEVQLSR